MRANTIHLLSIIFLTLSILSAKGQGIIQNASFEQGDSLQIDFWSKNAWHLPSVTLEWAPQQGRNGTHSMLISTDNNEGNDARFIQEINGLTPGTWYQLEGWVRGENIIAQGSVGANLCIEGTWIHSLSMQGTFAWEKISLHFQADSTGRTTIGCRLGFWGSLATGKVWFDDLSISRVPVTESTHFSLVLEQEDLNGITNINLERWTEHLDLVYESLVSLTGHTPFDGKKITILSVDDYPGGWAVAGNPIRWHQRYVQEELARINNHDDWSFGILHEISHNFDQGPWNFEAEFFANLKMYYSLEVLQGKVRAGENYYIGAALADFYQLRYADEKEEFWNTGDLTGYSGCLMHRFLQIQKQIGWEPFQRCFRYYLQLAEEEIPETRLDRFFLFLDKLSYFAGISIYPLIPPEEYNEFIAYIGGGIVNKIPTVDLGQDTSAITGDTLQFSPFIEDDGYPNSFLTYHWQILPDSAAVILSDTTLQEIQAVFPFSGNYDLVLEADDGQSIGRDTVQIQIFQASTLFERNLESIDQFWIYPNPVEKSANIEFYLKKDMEIALYLCTLNGQLVTRYQQKSLPRGLHRLHINQLSTLSLAAGLYLLILETPGGLSVRKVLVLPMLKGY